MFGYDMTVKYSGDRYLRRDNTRVWARVVVCATMAIVRLD